MTRWWNGFVAAAMLGIGAIGVRADELGPQIDLTAFDRATDQGVNSQEDTLPIQNVDWRLGDAPRRFYLSGMIGPSFANVTGTTDPTLASNGTVFSAGMAAGIAFEREHGRLRLEVEGMGRDIYDNPFTNPPRPDAATVITNNWSVLQNFWRDLMLTDRFGVYGGGGVGAGGYILGERFGDSIVYAPPGAAFAWQAGGGTLWQISDRLTFDVGYRFFQIDTVQGATYVQPSRYAASELMFTLRLYEPFRAWRQ